MQRCLNALWVSVGFLSLAMNAGCGQVMTSDEIHGSAAVSPAVARDAAPSRQSATVESDERVVTRASTAIVGKTQLDPSAPEPDIAARLTSEELIATGLLP